MSLSSRRSARLLTDLDAGQSHALLVHVDPIHSERGHLCGLCVHKVYNQYCSKKFIIQKR